MYPKASLTYRLWGIWNPSTQSWEIAILRQQVWSIFAWFWAFSLKIQHKSLILLFRNCNFSRLGWWIPDFLKPASHGGFGTHSKAMQVSQYRVKYAPFQCFSHFILHFSTKHPVMHDTKLYFLLIWAETHCTISSRHQISGRKR